MGKNKFCKMITHGVYYENLKQIISLNITRNSLSFSIEIFYSRVYENIFRIYQPFKKIPEFPFLAIFTAPTNKIGCVLVVSLV
jgi:hypothetical protein